MGRLKEFLINEQMRISGNWREKDHYDYLAWKKQLENELQYEQKERVRSLTYEQKGKSKDRQVTRAKRS